MAEKPLNRELGNIIMNTDGRNPPTNVLRAGATDKALEEAILSSGYPLQLVVARQLAPEFRILEEWAYTDSENGTTRTVDLVASRQLYDWKETQPRARPALNLILECKQSDLPYVFFLSDTQPWIPHFPAISGLKGREVVITSNDDPSRWNLSPLQLFEMDRHAFLRDEAPCCMTFSKCVWKGKDLTLSGSSSYQSLIFPLLKALAYFGKVQKPPPTAHYFDFEVAIPVAVLDAPMVGVRLTDSGPTKELLPWVRLARHEPTDGEHKPERGQILGVDVVHKDFLSTYIRHHVLPFATELGRLVVKHADVIADMKGFIPGMGEDSWRGLESRLRRASPATGARRWQAVLRAIMRIPPTGRNDD